MLSVKETEGQPLFLFLLGDRYQHKHASSSLTGSPAHFSAPLGSKTLKGVSVPTGLDPCLLFLLNLL